MEDLFSYIIIIRSTFLEDLFSVNIFIQLYAIIHKLYKKANKLEDHKLNYIYLLAFAINLIKYLLFESHRCLITLEQTFTLQILLNYKMQIFMYLIYG